MNFIIKIIIITLVFFINTTTSLAFKKDVDRVYNEFILKLENRFSDPNKRLQVLIKLNSNLLKIKDKYPRQKEIIDYLLIINKKEIIALNRNINSNLEGFILELIDRWYKYIEVNSSFEFSENWTIKRIIFSNYYSPDKNNYKYFLNDFKWGYLFFYDNSLFLVDNYDIEKKYSYKELSNIFTNYMDYDDRFILENWKYYTYRYSRFNFFNDNYWVYLSDLSRNNISKENSLYIKKWDKYYFSNDYYKVDLISSELASIIENKQEFLYSVFDDNKFIQDDYESILYEIKDKTFEIIKDKKNDDEKILAIYDWLVDNMVYYNNYTDWYKEIFSWVHSFKNLTWVCDWYTKLFLYMLSFAWIKDVSIIRWWVFNVKDFPDFWHAWVKIGDKYYDLTFDNISNIQKNIYFWLNYELMYLDRFEWRDLFLQYKDLSLEKRQEIALKNMFDIYDKYKNNLLLTRVKNYKYLGLNYNEKPTLDILKEKMDFYNFSNYKNNDNWDIKKIKTFKFYNIDSENVSYFVNSNIDLSNMKLFKFDNWEYKLAYDIVYK